jgi:hypothetical protein
MARMYLTVYDVYITFIIMLFSKLATWPLNSRNYTLKVAIIHQNTVVPETVISWIFADSLNMGCLVIVRTRSHVRPLGSTPLGDVATNRGMGIYTTRLFTMPVLKLV